MWKPACQPIELPNGNGRIQTWNTNIKPPNPTKINPTTLGSFALDDPGSRSPPSNPSPQTVGTFTLWQTALGGGPIRIPGLGVLGRRKAASGLSQETWDRRPQLRQQWPEGKGSAPCRGSSVAPAAAPPWPSTNLPTDTRLGAEGAKASRRRRGIKARITARMSGRVPVHYARANSRPYPLPHRLTRASLWRPLDTRDRKSRPNEGKGQKRSKGEAGSEHTSGWRREGSLLCGVAPPEVRWRRVDTLNALWPRLWRHVPGLPAPRKRESWAVCRRRDVFAI